MRLLSLAVLLILTACQGQSTTDVYRGDTDTQVVQDTLKRVPSQGGFGGRLTVTGQELALWRKRSRQGPYKTMGDAGPNTPGDWDRIRLFADEFVKSPFDSGNTSSQDLDLWTGYDAQIDSLDQYPIWQGIKMECAAFCYLVQGDTAAGNRARAALLRQVRMKPTSGRIGLRLGAWPVPASSQQKPTFESGTKECTWMLRLGLTYDYLLPLLTRQERTEVVAFLRDGAYYFARRAQKRFEECFPKRSENNYAVRKYLADPNGVRHFSPDPIYQTADRGMPEAYKGFIYTHLNADGSLGNQVSRLAEIYNNRTAERMNLILFAGLLSGDSYLIDQAKAYQREWLMFSVYPDGTYGEYERDGDYGNPSQGAMFYGGLCIQSYVLAADWLSRKGDKSLYELLTRDGAFNTVVPEGRTRKSLKTVLDRYVDNLRTQRPLYHGEVKPDNRIDVYNENPNAKFSTRYATWDYVLALANRHYQSPLYRRTYQRTEPGTTPYPGKDYSSAGKVWLPWSGTSAEFPGFLFMYGEELEK